MSTAWLWGFGSGWYAWLAVAVHVALQIVFVCRALLRPHREPASRLAWVVVIIVAKPRRYFFFGAFPPAVVVIIVAAFAAIVAIAVLLATRCALCITTIVA